MGRDKALLPYRGGSLLESVARTVEAAAGSVTLIGGAAQYGDFGFAGVADQYPGEGPLGGILTALGHTQSDWNLVVACDMPALTADFLRGLLDAAAVRDADALVPQGPAGRWEPLCAVYHRRTRNQLEAAFGRGIRKVTDAYAGVRVIAWPVTEMAALQNVNTPEDWSAYAAK